MPTTADIEHLLRRTEYVARPERVAELVAKPSLAAAVDDVLDVPADPGTVALTEPTSWQQAAQYTHFWFDRMAHDSPRPLQEKMAFFWHGHFCSNYVKVNSAGLMRDQIDLLRRDGLGDVRTLARKISTQVAMLRYLDNNQNKATSPNQNFARELMELFLLGVGNYTEADVEAGTAAWTGHTDDWRTGQYVWRADWHDGSAKQFLGRTINATTPDTYHGPETIDVVLGSGVVPAGAAVETNRGRPTREVAAEFLTRKLWAEFAGTPISTTVLAELRDVALVNDFSIRPWVKAILNHPEFYTTAVKRGRVRTPVEFIVASLVATGRRSDEATPLWFLDGMGQRPLYPPDVSGWGHNDYWINSSAMARRTDAAQTIIWRSMTGYWNGDGLIHLATGTISRHEMQYVYGDQPEALIDRMLALMEVRLSSVSRQVLIDLCRAADWWEYADLLSLILITPDFHMA